MIKKLTAALGAVLDAAWDFVQCDDCSVPAKVTADDGSTIAEIAISDRGEAAAIAEFIATARNAMPMLLQAAELVDELLDSYDGTCCDGCGVVDASVHEKALRLRELLLAPNGADGDGRQA